MDVLSCRSRWVVALCAELGAGFDAGNAVCAFSGAASIDTRGPNHLE